MSILFIRSKNSAGASDIKLFKPMPTVFLKSKEIWEAFLLNFYSNDEEGVPKTLKIEEIWSA